MNKIWKFFLPLPIVLTLAQSASAGDKLAGSEWAPIDNTTQFARFEGNGRLAGQGGCNRFFGSYEMLGKKEVNIGPLTSTKMDCSEPQMSEENRFFALLEQARTFEREAGKLRLFDSAGELLVELRQKDWD